MISSKTPAVLFSMASLGGMIAILGLSLAPTAAHAN
jgi:hypothetical protein